jgi:hypothetical protein
MYIHNKVRCVFNFKMTFFHDTPYCASYQVFMAKICNFLKKLLYFFWACFRRLHTRLSMFAYILIQKAQFLGIKYEFRKCACFSFSVLFYTKNNKGERSDGGRKGGGGYINIVLYSREQVDIYSLPI